MAKSEQDSPKIEKKIARKLGWAKNTVITIDCWFSQGNIEKITSFLLKTSVCRVARKRWGTRNKSKVKLRQDWNLYDNFGYKTDLLISKTDSLSLTLTVNYN